MLIEKNIIIQLKISKKQTFRNFIFFILYMATPQVSLPSEFNMGIDYSLPPDARSYAVKIQPSNISQVQASYTIPLTASNVNADQAFNSQQIYFDLPCGSSPSLFLAPGQTTLNYDVLWECTTAPTAGSVANAFLRGGAFSWFDGLRVVSQNGSIIEQIDEYGLTSNLISSLQMNNSVRDSVAVSYGFESGTTISNQGHSIAALSASATVTTKVRYSYSIPLMSGVLGVLNDKMLNLGRTSRIQLVMTTASTFPVSFESGATAFTGSAPVWRATLSNMSLNCEYVDIGMSALRMLDAASPDGINYAHGTTYRSTSSTLSATSGTVSVLAGLRASSIKSLFNTFQELGTQSTSTSVNGKYDSKNPILNTINYNVGGVKYPQTPVPVLLSPAQTFIELQKAIGAFNNSAYQSAINYSNFGKLSSGGTTQSLTVGATQDYIWNTGSTGASLCQFYYGCNLEVVNKKNILSGLNAISTPIFVELNIATTPTNAHTLYTIALCDHIIVHDTKSGDISVRI
jgi:hypothetical protein